MPDPCRTAREELKGLRTGDGHNTFFPLDSLKELFTRQKIQDILSCTCSFCQKHAQVFPGHHDAESYATTVVGGANGKGSGYFVVFGLLVYIEHPFLIIGFANKQKDDAFFQYWATEPDSFARNSLKQWTGQYASKHLKDFNSFARDFDANIAHFAIPHMTEHFVQYHERVVLPFCDEKEIGKTEGANSKVVAFKLHEGYRQFMEDVGGDLVRKQINTPEPQALLEKWNIEFVQKIKHDHVVRLIKVYSHGQSLNLILPKAKTNLNHVLRDQSMNYDTKIGPRAGPRIEESDAWKQTLGIAQALMKFQGLSKGPKEPMRQPGPGLLGIHFDLKPDNILVDERGTWLITDFGQAAIIKRQSGVSPRVGGHFGTDAYAPPEIDDPDTSFGRKYDVWSLGCILLEVTAFLVCGYPGLIGAEGFTGLDEARRAKPSWRRHPEERFFYQEARGGDWIVKKEILEFMDSLEPRYARALRRSDASKAFLSSILSLIKRMLQPNEKDRPDISRVIDILGSAIETSGRTTSTGNSRNNGDRKYTPSADSMKVLHWSDKHERWEDSVLTVLKRGEHIMQLRCGPVARDPIPIEFKTTGVKVLPLYAFWDPKQLAESQEWLSLAYHSKDTPLPVTNSAFSFNGNAGLREVRMLQSKLMSQDIVESYDIEHVCLTKQISKRKAVGRALKMLTSKDKVKPASSGRMSFRSATLQIWKEYDESIGQDVSDNATSIYDRPPRYWDNDKLKIPTCRISIHLHQQRFICTIRIDANWVLVPDPADEHIMYFRPHPSGSKEPFHASWIRPTPEDLDNELPAGVPLSPQVLWYMEDLDTFDVSQIQLNFTRAEDRNSFKQKYSNVKEAWANAREKLESQLLVNRIPEAKPLMPPDIDVPAMPREKVELLPSPASAVETSTSGTSIETRLSRGSTAGI